MIDVGILSCYFNIDELMQISEALWIARDEYGMRDWWEIMEYEEYLKLQERVSGYIKEYQRRMKDAT
jgi:hypothetical protein